MQLPSSPENRTDALTFLEVETNIERVFAVTISDKTSATVLPLILNNFVMGTTIYNDEGPCYKRLSSLGFPHLTVCHKYNFINPITGVHTQAVFLLITALNMK
jgi:hypothetical protein